ncbi:hypothetical protein ABZW30_08270 [Kitasatospora sp. NPDC004669]|uniref:hypothetical protein n=1 Tax=Kitasatospora sp. NPDC004669 TaxID=3154555 RepID=UPI0033AC0DD2
MSIALTRLDSRLEAALGDSISGLYASEARADAATARLIRAHRDLVAAETTVAFQRVRLINAADRKRRVDDAVLDELDAQLERLEEAAEQRDELEAELTKLIKAREDAAARAAVRSAVARSVADAERYRVGLVVSALPAQSPALSGRRR